MYYEEYYRKQTIQDRKLYHVKFMHDTVNHSVEVITVGAYSEDEARTLAAAIFTKKGYQLEPLCFDRWKNLYI